MLLSVWQSLHFEPFLWTMPASIQVLLWLLPWPWPSLWLALTKECFASHVMPIWSSCLEKSWHLPLLCCENRNLVLKTGMQRCSKTPTYSTSWDLSHQPQPNCQPWKRGQPGWDLWSSTATPTDVQMNGLFQVVSKQQNCKEINCGCVKPWSFGKVCSIALWKDKHHTLTKEEVQFNSQEDKPEVHSFWVPFAVM